MDNASVGLEKRVDLPYEQAVERARETLAGEGFGVLTEIDVKATLKKKIDADFKKYVILGTCNPAMAHRALSAENDVGLLLPCNVVVYEDGDGSVISAINPDLMVQLFDSDEMKAVAGEVSKMLRRAIEAI